MYEPVLKEKKWIIIDICIATIMIICVGFVLINGLSNILKSFPPNLIYIVSTSVSLFLGSIYLHIKYPFDFAIFGNKNDVNTIIKWGGLGFVLLFVINFPYKIVFGEGSIPKDYLVDPKNGLHFAFFYFVVAVILIPFIEELFYRVFLFRLIKNKFGLFSGYITSTLFFTAGHKFSAISIINSLVFCFIFDKTGLIGTSILAHVLLNFGWYTAVYY